MLVDITCQGPPRWSWKEPPHVILGHVEDNMVVGLLRIFIRYVHFEQCSYRCAAIGGLFTHEKYRGKGVGATLIESVCNQIDKSGNIQGISFGAVVANSRNENCVFEKCGFRKIAPCAHDPKRQSLWFKKINAVDGDYLFKGITPEEHF